MSTKQKTVYCAHLFTKLGLINEQQKKDILKTLHQKTH